MLTFPKRYADRVAKLRVPGGFLLVVVFAWLAHPTTESFCIGVPVSLVGLALRAWSAGCLAKNQQLATGGPYAYVRNPLYIGTLLVAAGLVIAARNGWLGLLFAAVFGLIYLPVIQLEEQHLRSLFPDYASYSASVPALIPKLRAIPQKNPQPFRGSLYLKNQEYQAGAGFAAGMLFLLWKLVAHG
ncbi:MAG TPA: isoprenylcysteine carboxylmethyltransferase family protein [Candidatus Limnocylindrales bacterium]|nr:isoprenylcysteine carboxylmethyltransferase family protein [Candidatus Limnocylindrales bacterium]